MPDILHRVGVALPSARVFEAISTVEGLSHWWVADTKGSASLNEVIDFGFCNMRVLESHPNIVRWECITGPKEWIGTRVTFELEFKDHQTFVLFRHTDWKEAVEFMYHCSTKWATFLLSLKSYLEKEEGRPHPYDVKICVGD
ncbi:SRPBCC domain-containing protein [Leptospira barantonii]|uniref:SRPBCC domain-containing protein n=1 Tax=Leptospira barantonii TaxID=2023184 RepID=A0A5F2B4Z4_9LEPT|nr:SRPBCC domain-containing protein [Leptospira barantonii]TGM00605.1 SRPBCC domain-containing protein [Leptospira barantonii]